jgi:hypothetical protein
MKYTAYQPNTDGSITILAGSSNPAVFAKILPAGTEYEVHEGETYTAGGKTWLSDTDEGYIEAKEAEEKQKALAELDAQYNADKANLLMAYQTSTVYGDTEQIESLKADLEALDEQYDADYEAIIGEDEEEE